MKNYKNNTKMFGICLLILGIVAIFSFGMNTTSAANSSSVYVNTHGNDDYDGLHSTYTNGTNGPKATIKNATGTVASNGTVHIAPGTYNENNIQINTNMTIIGENQKNTIINGQQSGNPIFTITSGVNITIINLTLTNGTTSNGGGAIDNNGTLTIDNSTFRDNTAQYGGAIINIGGTLTVDNSTFTNNTASNYGIGGGAIINIGGTLTVDNSTFTNNTASFGGGDIINIGFGGGAIINIGGTLSIDNCTFTNNTANNSFGGGAILNDGGKVTVDNSTFTNNTANSEGGAIINIGGTLTVNFNRIIGNTASSGNAIYNSGGTVDARYNWWGSNTNPSTNISGSDVSYDPWIVLTVTANPTTINVGGKSKITADLLHDSNGVYHDPVNGHVPDGITVNFSSDTKGTVTPISTITTNGIANTTFTGHFIGVSEVSATVDQQTVTTNITNQLTPTNSTTVHTTTTTTKIPMQHTGIPIAGLILAILTVIGGSLIPRLKK